MRKNILIPTDFSNNAWNALNYAVHLFKNEEINFLLLNAFQVYDYPTDKLLPPKGTGFASAKEKSIQGLEKIRDVMNIRTDNPNHQFEILSEYNTLVGAIRKTIKEFPIDLIIMGTKGENNYANTVYGSSAVEVIENISNCPVMAVPEKASVFLKGHKKEIVFSTNFKRAYTRNELDYLIEMARLFKAEIRVLHILEGDKLTEEQEENKKRIDKLLEGVPHGFNTLSNLKVATGIYAFMESRGSDMLALLHKKHSFFNSVFTVPLVKQMNFQQQVPLLALHD